MIVNILKANITVVQWALNKLMISYNVLMLNIYLKKNIVRYDVILGEDTFFLQTFTFLMIK